MGDFLCILNKSRINIKGMFGLKKCQKFNINFFIVGVVFNATSIFSVSKNVEGMVEYR